MTLSTTLENLFMQLAEPNEVDTRFSGDKFRVTPEMIEDSISYLQKDLIVIKVSGKLLIDEKDTGESLTRRDYLTQTMALLSQLGLNVFLIHGGQEQLDTLIKYSPELSDEDREFAMMKKDEVRYTPTNVLPFVINLSSRLSSELALDIYKAGGNANPYPSALFLGKKISNFTDPETKKTYYGNNFGHIPLGDRIQAIEGEGKLTREERVIRYLSGGIDKKGVPPGDAPGHIAVRGFLVDYEDPKNLGKKRKGHEDPYTLNGDADNIAAAHVIYFSNKSVVPIRHDDQVELTYPTRVHMIEIARNGGLRVGPRHYQSIVDVVTHENDLKNREIEGGMKGKVRNCLQVARLLSKGSTPATVKIIHPRELIPYLFRDEMLVRQKYGAGYGTTFAPAGLMYK